MLLERLQNLNKSFDNILEVFREVEELDVQDLTPRRVEEIFTIIRIKTAQLDVLRTEYVATEEYIANP